MILPEYKSQVAEMVSKMELLSSAWFVTVRELDRVIKYGEVLLKTPPEDISSEHLNQLMSFINESRMIRERSIKIRADIDDLNKKLICVLEANEATVEAMKLTGTPLPEEEG
jgi:hypothetical protein